MLHCPDRAWSVILHDVLRLSRSSMKEVFRSDIEAGLGDWTMIIARRAIPAGYYDENTHSAVEVGMTL
jgi:hypothetical protein